MYLSLFLTFCKIGAFTFGGGWAMVAIMEREIVDRHHWVTREEFLDLLAVAQSLPGILTVNLSVSIGDKLRGGFGSLVSVLGTILPSFIIILAIAIFLTPEAIMTNETLGRIFSGIRPAVVALIIVPVVRSARVAKIGWKTAFIPVAVALLIYSKIPVLSNPILYIVFGAVGGYIYYVHKNINATKSAEEEPKEEQ